MGPADNGIVRGCGRVDVEVALEVVVPVEQVGLEVDVADKRDRGRLGAGKVEVCEGGAAADGARGDMIWVGREAAGDIEDVAVVHRATHEHSLWIDGP